MRYIKITLLILALIVAIASCGGNSGGGEKNPIREIKGYVIDGNISEANVSAYKLSDAMYEDNKTDYYDKYKIKEHNITNESGHYALYVDRNISDIEIISSGGEDVLTKEIFEGILRAKISFNEGDFGDDIYVTPLSTLVAVSVNINNTNSYVDKVIKYNLNIDKDFSLINHDPMGSKLDDKLKLKLFQATQQIQKVAEIVKETLRDDIHYEQIFKAIYLTMASKYNDNTRAISKEQEVLKSSLFIDNVLNFVKKDNKRKSKIKLEVIGTGIKSIIDIIHSDDVKIEDIVLSAMAIEVVSNSYEEKAKEINNAVDTDKDMFDLKSDVDDVSKIYIELSKVKDVIKKAQKLAKERKKVVSLAVMGAFLAKNISSKTINDLGDDNIQNIIDKSVVSEDKKNIANNNILQGSLEPLTGGIGGGSSGSGGGGGSSGSDNNNNNITDSDGGAKKINDSNKSNYPSIPISEINVSIIENNATGKADQNRSDTAIIPDVSNAKDEVPELNKN